MLHTAAGKTVAQTQNINISIFSLWDHTDRPIVTGDKIKHMTYL